MGYTYFRNGFFSPDDQILNVAAKFSKNTRTSESFLSSVITVCLLKYLIMKYLIFLQVICVFKDFLWGSMTNAKVYQGFLDDKKVEEH